MLLVLKMKKEDITAKNKNKKDKEAKFKDKKAKSEETNPFYDKEFCEKWLKENQSNSINIFL